MLINFLFNLFNSATLAKYVCQRVDEPFKSIQLHELCMDTELTCVGCVNGACRPIETQNFDKEDTLTEFTKS